MHTQSHQRLVGYLEVGLYAALIFFAIMFLRIPMPGGTMVHVGNALVVLSVLLLGFKRGMAASLLGLLIFDLNAGYGYLVIFTLLEAALVMILVNWVYRHLFKGRDSRQYILALAGMAGLIKILSRPVSITIQQIVLGNSWQAVMASLIEKMPATFLTAIVTAVLVGILYYPMKQAILRLHPLNH